MIMVGRSVHRGPWRSGTAVLRSVAQLWRALALGRNGQGEGAWLLLFEAGNAKCQTEFRSEGWCGCDYAQPTYDS